MQKHGQPGPNVFTFRDERPPADPVLDYPPSLRDNQVPIVIDNGTFQCRAGWANIEKPLFTFKNITARQRGKKESDLQVGNEIQNIEVIRWLLRTQFDRNVVSQYDVQEIIFDYLFSHMGINTDGQVNHPIVLTEAVCNPNYSRQQMSELLFECYHMPQVAYGIDAMFSLYHHSPHVSDALVVDCGYQTTHILPVVGGHLDAENCRRINVGGAQLDAFMQRLLQLKYPVHLAANTLSRSEEMIREHAYMAVDYMTEVQEWISPEYYNKHVHKIQLPFTQVPANQLNVEQQKERRQQQIRRLKDLNAKRRLEKVGADEEKLQQLVSVQQMLEEEEDEDLFNTALVDLKYNNVEELQAAINHLMTNIQRTRAKILGIDVPAEEPEVKEAPVYDLLDIPDDQLTTEQIAAKKRQRILHNAREGRARAQAVQRARRQKELEEERHMEERRRLDFQGWLKEVREKRQKLMESRSARKQKKSNMAKRRTAASQERMRIISQLAENKISKKKEDTFGQNDADWEVYKEINPEGGDSDSEAEEEQLEELETLLREHDPEFQKELEENSTPPTELDIAEYYRLHLAVERIRVPELLFQPSLVGVDQAGIAETIEYILKKYPAEKQNKLVQHVYLTGGNAHFPKFRDRLEKELLAMRPFQSSFKVYTAANPSLDAWYGARKWAFSPLMNAGSVTRQEYEEKGGEYLKEHVASNKYVPTPILMQV